LLNSSQCSRQGTRSTEEIVTLNHLLSEELTAGVFTQGHTGATGP